MNIPLLVIAEEDLDGEPSVTADLEAVLQVAKLLHVLVGQLPAVKVEVGLNAGRRNGLGDDAGAALEAPLETASLLAEFCN